MNFQETLDAKYNAEYAKDIDCITETMMIVEALKLVKTGSKEEKALLNRMDDIKEEFWA